VDGRDGDVLVVVMTVRGRLMVARIKAMVVLVCLV